MSSEEFGLMRMTLTFLPSPELAQGYLAETKAESLEVRIAYDGTHSSWTTLNRRYTV